MHHFVGALVYHSGGSQVVQKLSGRGVDRASARGDEIKVSAPGGWHFQARSLVMDWAKTASLRSRLGLSPQSTLRLQLSQQLLHLILLLQRCQAILHRIAGQLRLGMAVGSVD